MPRWLVMGIGAAVLFGVGCVAALSHFETDTENGRSVVAIKDSFANAFVPFLTSNYHDIYVMDPRCVNKKGKPDLNLIRFAKEHQVDDVIFLNYPFPMNSTSWCETLERLIL